MMTEEWCRRSSHFFNIWLNQDDWEFRYTPEDLASYLEDLEWVSWLADEVGLESDTWARAQELRRRLPVNP